MSEADAHSATKQSNRFLYLYALAVAGGAVAYVPFLTVLLPNQALGFGRDTALTLLAQAAFAGAVAASLANISFGWLSDVTKTRTPWIWLGLLLSGGMLAVMPMAAGPVALISLIICWQIGLNMMLAPLAAWAGDCVPDGQKGLLGGLLAFAPALGALSGAFLTLPGLVPSDWRLFAVAALVALMVVPALVFGRPHPMPGLMAETQSDENRQSDWRLPPLPVVQMWLARLLVQIAEASLFAFLLLWFRSIAPAFRDNDAASIFALVLAAAVLVTLVVGRWSDRTDRPILPLGVCAAIAALGLLIMGLADQLSLAIFGYVVFGSSSAIFLALHSSQTLRVLPAPRTRGRDLGLFNLTNTVPSMIMPWLTLALVPVYGFAALFFLLSGFAAIAAFLLIAMDQFGRRA